MVAARPIIIGSALALVLIAVASAISLQSPVRRPAADAVVFEDQSGRIVTLPATPQRIVTIPMPAASMLIAVDGDAHRLVGMHPQSHEAMNEGILARIFPAVRRIATDVVGSGFVPNVEEMLKVQPDLVFQWGERGDDLILPLQNAGLEVAALTYGDEADVVEWIRIMGQALNDEERSSELLNWRRASRAEVAEAVSRRRSTRGPRTLYFQRFNSGLQVSGSGTYSEFYIDLAGGENPANAISGSKVVGVEQVLAWDPEVILLNNFEPGLEPADVYDHPLLSATTAARERRVYKVPLGGYRWDPPSHESPLMWQWLAMVLHPNEVHFPMRERIGSAYRLLYGYELSPVEVDEILRIPTNGQSAHYEIFAS